MSKDSLPVPTELVVQIGWLLAIQDLKNFGLVSRAVAGAVSHLLLDTLTIDYSEARIERLSRIAADPSQRIHVKAIFYRQVHELVPFECVKKIPLGGGMWAICDKHDKMPLPDRRGSAEDHDISRTKCFVCQYNEDEQYDRATCHTIISNSFRNTDSYEPNCIDKLTNALKSLINVSALRIRVRDESQLHCQWRGLTIDTSQSLSATESFIETRSFQFHYILSGLALRERHCKKLTVLEQRSFALWTPEQIDDLISSDGFASTIFDEGKTPSVILACLNVARQAFTHLTSFSVSYKIFVRVVIEMGLVARTLHSMKNLQHLDLTYGQPSDLTSRHDERDYVDSRILFDLLKQHNVGPQLATLRLNMVLPFDALMDLLICFKSSLRMLILAGVLIPPSDFDGHHASTLANGIRKRLPELDSLVVDPDMVVSDMDTSSL